LNEIRYKYENALQNYTNPIPSIYVINRASPSFEKASPSFIINGLIIIPATLLLIIGLLLGIEVYGKLRKAL